MTQCKSQKCQTMAAFHRSRSLNFKPFDSDFDFQNQYVSLYANSTTTRTSELLFLAILCDGLLYLQTSLKMSTTSAKYFGRYLLLQSCDNESFEIRQTTPLFPYSHLLCMTCCFKFLFHLCTCPFLCDCTRSSATRKFRKNDGKES